MKRFATLLFTIFMVISMTTTAWAATTASASVLRLESIQGTVTITNSAGRTLTASENMRLLNGYTITTSGSSYAYVSLDDSKAVKLDALTSCTIRQQGSSLELLVETGSIFFNVTAPLSSNETMDVRTSTMVTGIRGTSGTVWSNGVNQSGTRLHTGTATVTTVNPSGGTDENGNTGDTLKTATVTAGQEAISSHNDSEGTSDLNVVDTNPEDYSGFELDAISNEDGLLDEILENDDSPLTQEVVAEADTRLEEEQATQSAQEEAVASQQDDQTASDSTETAPTTSTSTSSGSSSVTTTATVSTYAALTSALSNSNIVTITISGNITLEGDIIIASGVTMTINEDVTLTTEDYTITLEDTATLTNNGTVTSSNAAFLILPTGYDFISEYADDLYTLSAYYDYDTTIDGEEDWTDLVTALETYDTVTVDKALTMTGETSLSAGTIDLGSNTLTVDGDLTVSGGTIKTTGATAITVGDGSFAFSSGTVSAASSIVVSPASGYAITVTETSGTYYLDEYYAITNTLTHDCTWDTVETALATYGTVTIAATVTLDGSEIIDADDAVTVISGGTIVVGTNTLTTNGDLTVSGGAITTDTALFMGADGSISIDAGSITATGTTAINASTGTFVFDGGTVSATSSEVVTVPTGYSITTSGSHILTGYYDFDTTIDGEEDWTDLEEVLTVYDTVTVDKALTMTGETSLSAGTIDLGSNTLTVDGDLTVSGGTIKTTGATAITVGDGTFAFTSGTVSAASSTVVSPASGYAITVTETSGTYYLDEYYAITNTLTHDCTWDTVETALATYGTVTIAATVTLDESEIIDEDQSITIAAGGTIDVGANTLTIADGAILSVNGTLTGTGTVLVVSDGATLNYTYVAGTAAISSEDGNLITIPEGYTATIGEDDSGCYLAAYYTYDDEITTGETWDDVTDALTAFGTATVTEELTLDADGDISTGTTLIVASTAGIDTGDYTILVSGTLTVNGAITGTGTVIDTSNGTFSYDSATASITSTSADLVTVPTGYGITTDYADGLYTLTGYNDYDAYITTGEDWTDVASAFSSYDTVTISTTMDTLTEDYAIPTGKTLVIGNDGSVNTSAWKIVIGSGNSLTVNGTLTGSATVIDASAGTLTYTYDDGASITSTIETLITLPADWGFTTTGDTTYTLTGFYEYDATISGDETWDDVKTALDTYAVVTISGTNSDLSMDAAYEIVSGKTLIIDTGVIVNINVNDLTVSGVLTNKGTITTSSTSGQVSISENATMTNTGTGTVTCTSINASYVILNSGIFNLDGGSTGSISNSSTGVATITSGTITNVNAYVYAISNSGTLILDGTLGTETGEILIQAKASTQVISDSTTTYTVAERDVDGTTYHYATGTTSAVIDGDETWADVIIALDYFDEITIDKDITATADVTSGSSKTVTKKITIGDNGSLTVGDGYTLTINNTYTGDIKVASGGTLLASGYLSKIDGNVTNYGTVTLTASDATITGAVTNYGTFNLNSGSVEMYVVNYQDATFNITYGSIGTNVENYGTFNMSGGSIIESVDNDGTFNFNDGTISFLGNNSGAEFNMYGGAFTNADDMEVTNSSGAEFNLYGGTIANAVNNYGIFKMEAYDGATGTISTSGTTFTNSANGTLTMSGGTISTSSTTLYAIDNSGTLDFSGGTFGNETGNILVKSASTNIISNGETYYGSAYDDDNKYYYVTAELDVDAYVDSANDDWDDLVLALEYFDEVTLSTAITTSEELTLEKGKTLILADGAILTSTNSGTNGIYIYSGATLIIQKGASYENTSSDYTIYNKGTLTVNGGTLSLRSYSNTILNDGATFEMTDGEISCGGISTTNSGKFTISGGTINGGITISSGASFTMDGGTISGMINSSSGMYALLLSSTSSFTMSAGTIENTGNYDYAIINPNTTALNFTGTFSTDGTNDDGTKILIKGPEAAVLSDSSGTAYATKDYDGDYYLTAYGSDTLTVSSWNETAPMLEQYAYVTITAATDITMTSACTLGAYQTLDLGGNSLTLNADLTLDGGTITTTGETAIIIPSDYSLTYSSGTITAGSEDILTGEGAGLFSTTDNGDGSYSLDGYLSGNYVTSQDELELVLASGQTAIASASFSIDEDLTMEGDTLEMGGYTLTVKAELTATDNASITAEESGSIVIETGGTLQITNGAIFSSDITVSGGTLYVYSDMTGDIEQTGGIVKLYGGTLTGDVIISSGASFTMEADAWDPTIKGTVTNSGSFTMNDGTITSAATYTFNNTTTGSFSMSAGTIENTATEGVYFAIYNGNTAGLSFMQGAFYDYTTATGDILITSLIDDAHVILEDDNVSSVYVPQYDENNEFYYLASYAAVDQG